MVGPDWPESVSTSHLMTVLIGLERGTCHQFKPKVEKQSQPVLRVSRKNPLSSPKIRVVNAYIVKLWWLFDFYWEGKAYIVKHWITQKEMKTFVTSLEMLEQTSPEGLIHLS
jgi:hypothetical protein